VIRTEKDHSFGKLDRRIYGTSNVAGINVTGVGDNGSDGLQGFAGWLGETLEHFL
jgi:hypothetical protein